MEKSLIKNQAEIEIIAEGGKLLARILHKTADLVKPGVSTRELNDFTEKMISNAGGRPSFKGFGEKSNPFPAALCTSINDVIVHGIPSREAILKEGDIIKLDAGMEYKRLYTDAAMTLPVGKVSDLAKRLIAITKKCLDEAIKTAKAGNTTGDIGFAIQSTAERVGFSVVRDLVGHGVGFSVHEDPQIPCYGKPGQGIKLQAGMVLAIEPMLCEGSYKIVMDDDGWTIRTADRGLAAHFEHTIAITDSNAKILT